MKKSICIALYALTIVFFPSCHKREYWAVRGKGDVVTQTRDLSGFSSIRLACSADVTFEQDSAYSVRVTGQQNILDVLTTENHGGELRIDFSRDVWGSKPVRVEVRGPRMHSMTISGSGNIRSDSKITTGSISLRITGSGNISLLSLVTTEADATLSGSGNIEIAGGTADRSTYTTSGSGNINGEFFECRHNVTNLSGSGNVRVFATETLHVTISGSGDVRYRGTPGVDVSISGSGTLRKI